MREFGHVVVYKPAQKPDVKEDTIYGKIDHVTSYNALSLS